MKGKIMDVLIGSAENENDAIDGTIKIKFSGRVYNVDAVFLDGYVPYHYVRNKKAISNLKGKNIEFKLDILVSDCKKIDKHLKEIKVPNKSWDTIIYGEIIESGSSTKKRYLDCGVYRFEVNQSDALYSYSIGEFVQLNGLLRIKIIQVLDEKN